MNVISRRRLREFWATHADAEEPLSAWYKVVVKAKWANLEEIKAIYPSTDYVGNDRYVFNIKGNRYRLVAKIDFACNLVLLRFVGIHAEYDKIDASKV